MILDDARYRVPEAPPATYGLAWLRATVSRFVNGEVHTRRRALVERELARLDVDALRAEARERARRRRDDAPRAVPLAVLCRALGVSDADLDTAVAAAKRIGPAYVPGDGDEQVDAAVESLRRLLDRGDEERTAAAIQVLAQSCEATARLIENALELAEPPVDDVDALLERTLRERSPVPPLRRIGPDGAEVTVDPAGIPFGAGIRPCPGRREALALAAGVLEGLVAAAGA